MSRPPKPPLTDAEHQLIHDHAIGLRTAAAIISRNRGAESASATATEKAWRTVSFAWIKRQHQALGCNKTLSATKPQPSPRNDSLQQNQRPMDEAGTRITLTPSTNAQPLMNGPPTEAGKPSTVEVDSEQPGATQ